MKGSLNFSQNDIPVISPANYKITVKQKTDINNCTIGDAVLNFIVDAEQISLSLSEVYSVYPPKSSAGLFGKTLPHIVLHRRTLPWERQIFKDQNVPWLALLVFSEDEGVVSYTSTYEQAILPQNGLFIPQIKRLHDEAKEPCNPVDIPKELFTKVLPSREDIPYLAHTRFVQLDDKVTDPAVKEGWFSCVVANRYPKTPQEEGKNIQHAAYLVSIEGFQDCLNGDRDKILKSYDKVRMFALAQWSFGVTSESFDFSSLAANLKITNFKADVTGLDENIQKLVNLGYLPLEHTYREGSTSVSWYRSPFLPQPLREERIELCCFSDKLLRYDPRMGMFDVSYSCAWQLGRLLAIRKKGFAKSVIEWRLKNKQKGVTQQNVQAMCMCLDYGGPVDSEQMNEMNVSKWAELVQGLVTYCSESREEE